MLASATGRVLFFVLDVMIFLGTTLFLVYSRLRRRQDP
jgi:hypothetical protein